jgi:hypothetical protein
MWQFNELKPSRSFSSKLQGFFQLMTCQTTSSMLHQTLSAKLPELPAAESVKHPANFTLTFAL